MRVLLWHGWLLEGSGSNVYTARTAEALCRTGHDVLVLCQEPRPDRFAFVRAWGTVAGNGVSALDTLERDDPIAERGAILLRPQIGSLLPVFVVDEYEGFEVKRFVDLTADELEGYLAKNVRALRAAAEWFRPHAVVLGHAVPGSVIGARALSARPYVVKIHGSDLEYAIREQDRYRRLATEGLRNARTVVGASRDVLARAVELVPEAAGKTTTVPPGVDAGVFRPASRRAALQRLTALLHRDVKTVNGRPNRSDGAVREALGDRGARALDDLAAGYDQAFPDRGAVDRLGALVTHQGPLVGYLGKFIPQKGVELLLQATATLARTDLRTLVIGFGSFREWLAALVVALDGGDVGATRWLADASPLRLELTDSEIRRAEGSGRRVVFTGRLDHVYAPHALAALDVLVVPSILHEAFGMVAAEGASAGALPLVARHSGLAEVADALESAVGRTGLFSFEPGPGATRRIGQGIERLLAIPRPERLELGRGLSRFVRREWTWDRTAERLLAAAQ